MKHFLTKFVNHIYSLVSYCFGTQPYEIRLKCKQEKALDLIMSSQKDFGIHVISVKDGIIELCATKHARSRGARTGTPIVPIFTGKFINKTDCVVLCGTISLLPGIKVILSMFCFAFYVLLPLMWIFNRFGSNIWGEGSFWVLPIGIIVLTCLLEFGYGLYKKDVFCIRNFLGSIF